MMRAFPFSKITDFFITICLIILLLGTGYPVYGQSTLPSTGSHEREKTDKEKPELGTLRPASSPQVISISAACIRPGDILTVSGENLAVTMSPINRQAYLLGGRKKQLLDILSWSDKRIQVRIPLKSPLDENQRYKIWFQFGGKFQKDLSLARYMKSCPVIARAPIPPSATSLVSRQSQSFEQDQVVFLGWTEGNQASMPAIADITSLIGTLQQSGYQVKQQDELKALGLWMLVLTPPVGVSLGDAIINLQQSYPDATIDLNYHYLPSAGDPSGGPRVYAPDLINWPTSIGHCNNLDPELAIGIIDGGVDLQHPALTKQENIHLIRLSHSSSANSISGKIIPSNHGTALAVLLKGQVTDDGFKGLLPRNPLFAADVLEHTPSGPIAKATAILRGLNWMALRKVSLINLSLEGEESAVLNTGLFAVANKGIFLFAAAGNGGRDAFPPYPAASQYVLGITAVDPEMVLYKNATIGDHVSFSAPGVDIWLAKVGGGGSYRSGTSFATPFVVATAAMILSKDKERLWQVVDHNSAREKLTIELSKYAIDLGPSGPDKLFGWGLIQAPKDC